CISRRQLYSLLSAPITFVLFLFSFLLGSVPNGAPKPLSKISLFLLCPDLKRKTRSFFNSTGFFSFVEMLYASTFGQIPADDFSRFYQNDW
ncbi:MAG TPA: hypothetical protein VGB71_10860, partial [Flavisolibacter sp.]